MSVRILAFDLNGTLTDLSALDRIFRAEFGGSRVRREWFTEALKIAFALTVTGQFQPFSEILKAALKVIEERHDHKLSAGMRKAVLLGMRALPFYSDVRPGLERLRARGFRLVVLTNSSLEAAEQGIQSAGIAQLFEAVLSAESVKRLKPAPEPYEMAAQKCGVKAKEMMLVASHSWDIGGAANAGYTTAFVRRPGQVLDELTPQPEYVVSDLVELSEKLK